ncbi:MAG: hypothetical protein AAGA18_05460 [Verrucomicrobiota bacterium]
MMDLVEIIQEKCLPERNCMLTVQDQSGETGFLYFKEAQIIEANCGGEWGNQAFAIILAWQIQSHSISELPLGIKRTLWDPIDKLIEDIRGVGSASGVREVVKHLPMNSTVSVEPDAPYGFQDKESQLFTVLIDRMRDLEGLIALFHEGQDRLRLVTGTVQNDKLNGQVLLDFSEAIENLGGGLGAGRLMDWYIETDQSRIWQISANGEIFYLVSNKDVMPDEFASQFRECLEGL